MTVSPRSFTSPRARRPRQFSTTASKSGNTVLEHPTLKRTNGQTKPGKIKTFPGTTIGAPSKVTSLLDRTDRNTGTRLTLPTQPAKPTLPLWVRIFLGLQQGSSLIAVVLVTSVLTVYASTVYIQQQWSRNYQNLENLQREERNLAAADEIFKNQLAQQAQRPETGLVDPSPANTIFLPRSTTKVITNPTATTKNIPTLAKTPLGY